MKQIIKGILLVLALLAVPFLIWIGWMGMQFVRFQVHISDQMEAGRQYMDALEPEDIQVLIVRAEALLTEYDSSDPIPEDLQALKVFRITMSRPDYVSIDWMGGIDHTELVFRRMPTGDFEVTAVYCDEDQRVLWPVDQVKTQQ